MAYPPVNPKRRHCGGARGRAHDVLLRDIARPELNPGSDRRARRPAGLVLPALAEEIERQPVAPLGRVHEEHRRAAHRGMKEVGFSIAVEIGGHADGIAVAAPSPQRVSWIDVGRVHESRVRPVVEQERWSAAAVATVGIGDHDVEIAIVVDIHELSAGPPQCSVLGRELGVPLELPATPIVIQDQLLAGKDEKIAVACLERVARGRADGSGDVKLGRLGIEQPVPAHPEILPAEWLARG